MIPDEAEFIAALRKVVTALETLGIEYALGGSFASSLYGEARATRDVDLIAAVAGRHAAPLVAALGQDFYADEPQIIAAAMNQASFNLIHLPTMAKVDIFVVWRTDFGRAQLARRCRKQIGTGAPLDLYVTSAKTPCSPNLSGIERAVASLSANGATCSAFLKSRPRPWTAPTCASGPRV